MQLFDRYLSGIKIESGKNTYPDYSADIELVSFCLMPNHIHLLVRQQENDRSLQAFMSSLMTSYSKYFNKRHKRLGSLFESRYKARDIDDDSYLMHISRYIDMNPRYWRRYRYSSLQYVHGEMPPPWLHNEVITDMFADRHDYINFLVSYEDRKQDLKAIKHMLADT